MNVCPTLLTLTPTFSSRPDPCDSVFSRISSLGISKDRPSIVRDRGSRFRGRSSPLDPGDEPPFLPRSALWFCTTSAVVIPRSCRFVSPCCRSWGSPRFTSSRNEDPRGAFLPFEVFPLSKAFSAARVCVVPLLWSNFRSTHRSGRGHHRKDHCWPPVHRPSCPPTLFPRDVRSRFLNFSTAVSRS